MTINGILEHVTIERIFTAVLTVSTMAKAFCAATETPAANTTWGKIYRLIEVVALTIGKSKQTPVATITAIGGQPVDMISQKG
jgi:hypothetical protein